jgi:hypothetical protein
MPRFYVSQFRALSIVGLCLSGGSLAAAQTNDSTPQAHQAHAVEGGGALPAGWSARPDAEGDLKSVKFVTMEPGYHLTLGPATILYREEDRANGPFHTLAIFHQMKKLEHAEGYGLFFAGESLTAGDQRYIYFLVRDDGKYLIKRRDGANTTEITKGWIASPAIKKGDARGRATNLLEIDAKRDPARVSFKVNGATVHTVNAGSMKTKGIVGLRANHNLDLHVEGFALHQ